MIQIHSWPRAILHIDADAFFASVEQSLHPELKGRPVITGVERGIVAAASYEAKARGVRRGVPLSEVKRLCPGCVMLPSDYETYSLFSKRMFAILRSFTPVVEEYSIDEAFCDLTGLRRLHHGSYTLIARKIQWEVHRELGISVSVGLSLSKSLAKLCSKFRKPQGLTAVPGRYIHLLLERTPLEEIWGIGPNSSALLSKLGLKTALDFVLRPEGFVQRLLGKVGREIWMELRGESVYKVNPIPKSEYQSIGKSKTFVPPSSDPEYLLAQLLRNLESACIKARRYNLVADRLIVYLRRNDFSHAGVEVQLSRPTVATLELAPIARELFWRVFESSTPSLSSPLQRGRGHGESPTLYRATGVVLGGLHRGGGIQFGLFESPLSVLKVEAASQAIDTINGKFGKHTIHVGTTEGLKGRPRGKNEIQPFRKKEILIGETARQRLAIPMLST